MWIKNKDGLIEPADDQQYQTILALRARDNAEVRLSTLEEQIKELRRAVGLND